MRVRVKDAPQESILPNQTVGCVLTVPEVRLWTLTLGMNAPGVLRGSSQIGLELRLANLAALAHSLPEGTAWSVLVAGQACLLV